MQEAMAIRRELTLTAEEGAPEATSVDESGKFSTHTGPDRTAQITGEMIDRAWAEVCARAHPAACIAAFKGYAAVRSMLRSILRNGQLDPGKKTESGKTFIGLHRELCCILLGLEFRFEQTDLSDNDPRVVAAATDSNTEGRHYSVGQAICTAVRERLYYAEHFPDSVPTFEELAAKYKKSGRSVRDALKVYDAHKPLFECIEKDWTSVHEAEEIVDTVEPASWREAVKILSEHFETTDREISADVDCAGDENIPEQRSDGDRKLRDFKHGKIAEQLKEEKKRKQKEEAERRKKERKERSERLKNLPRPPSTKPNKPATVIPIPNQAGGMSDGQAKAGQEQAGAAALDIHPHEAQPLVGGEVETGTKGTHEVAATDPPAPSSHHGPASDEQADIGRQPTAAPEQTTEDDTGVFADALTALIHVQALLRQYRATRALIEALETTLKAAQESLQ